MALTGYGFVKEVLSGDSLVIIGQPRNGPPPELKLTLASLQAPRLALKPTTMSSTNLSTSDQEPFAWASRQFLLAQCLGKKVFFKVEYTVQAIGRQFGAVHLINPDNSHAENLCITVARAGWAAVRLTRDNERSGDLELMQELHEAAMQSRAGIYQDDPRAKAAAIRSVKWDFTGDEVGALYARLKKAGRPVEAQVEYIRDGASLKALLLESMTLITFNLAGVQSPREERDLQEEARFFTEARLLNRKVLLEVGGVSEKYSTFFGSVLHENGRDISEELARAGLALPVDWSMAFAAPGAAQRIHAAAHEAKAARRRLWKGYVAPAIPGESRYCGVVCEVLSGDALVVKLPAEGEEEWRGEERRVQLSSVRCPRGQGEAFAEEAKEFMRKSLIGKKVEVSVEYVLESKDNGMKRKFGTVMVGANGKSNAAVLLLREGLAQCVQHKQGAERSEVYHELLDAERQAKEAGKNLWAAKKQDDPKPLLEINTPQLAKSYLPNLQNNNFEKRTSGIVQYIFSASRYKIHIPSLGANVVLNLSCVNAPKAKEDSKHHAEGVALARHMCLQRSVEFTVETVDKGGNFIGGLFVKGRTNVGSVMVQRGLAKVNGGAARYAKNGDELLQYESKAREARVGVWENYEEPEEVEVAKEVTTTKGKKGLESLKVEVCHINDGNSFFFHVKSEKAEEQLKEVSEMMTKFVPQTPTEEESFKKNDLCVSQFDEGDGLRWYRAKVLSVDKESGEKKYNIRYIDYGNEEQVASGRLRRAPEFKVDGLAQEACLAFVSAPELDQEFGRDAALYLSQLTRSGVLTAKVHSKEKSSGKWVVSIFPAGQEMVEEEDEEGGEEKEEAGVEERKKEKTKKQLITVNGLLLREGLATMSKKARAYQWGNDEEQQLLKQYEVDQEVAHAGRVNLWAYGDPRDDEDDQRF